MQTPTAPWKPLIEGKSRDDFLLTGDEFRETLRDGRRVVGASGRDIEDVTKDSQLGPGIDTLADYYDAHFRPETRDLLTYQDEETGKTASVPWKVPETVEDLEWKRAVNRFSTYHFVGSFGRPPDYAPLNPLGLLATAPEIAKIDARWADNVQAYLRWARQNCVVESDVIVEVQSDRRVPLFEKAGRLRCVEERSDGLVLYGAKPCNSVSAQGHVGTVMTLLTPGVNPDSILFAAVPLNSPGLTMVCREPVAAQGNRADHPIDFRGEEIDAFMIFDHVFLPNEFVFCYRRPDLVDMYHEIGALCLWHILTRIAYKAEIFTGTAQLIASVLGTTNIPQVRDSISELAAYATTLMSFVIASEKTATLRNGVLIPNERYVTAGRLHSVVNYPRMIQLLKDISGQGLISRFTASQWDRADIGPRLDEFLPGTGCSAREKNQLFNFVWDLTSGANANRIGLFENVNATPPSAMRGQIYDSEFRKEWTSQVAGLVGLPWQS